MTARKPVLAAKPSSQHPTTPRPLEHKQWTFSFRYFRQIEFFGLSEADATWFVSLIQRLTVLSQEPLERMKSDATAKDAWRYHHINWSQKNIPIQRSDLTWVAPRYRDNETEYPLIQFMVSQSLGRVVGFWDEDRVFNIVLLDHLHNLQPTKSFAYRVDKCSPVDCRYTSILGAIEKARVIACNGNNCPSYHAMQNLPIFEETHTAILIRVDDLIAAELTKSVDAGYSLHDIFELGLGCANAQSPKA